MNRKITALLFTLSLAWNYTAVQAQAVKPTNTYPTNLEENLYFEGYDAQNQIIKGVNFMVLTDGNNSLDRTPPFVTKIYLFQEGEDPIFIKTYEFENGMKHMSAKEMKNDQIHLGELNIEPGIYRLGIYTNAHASFQEEMSDNAILFRDPINIKKSSTNKPGGIYDMEKKSPEKPKSDEEEGDEVDEDDDDDSGE